LNTQGTNKHSINDSWGREIVLWKHKDRHCPFCYTPIHLRHVIRFQMRCIS